MRRVAAAREIDAASTSVSREEAEDARCERPQRNDASAFRETLAFGLTISCPPRWLRAFDLGAGSASRSLARASALLAPLAAARVTAARS